MPRAMSREPERRPAEEKRREFLEE